MEFVLQHPHDPTEKTARYGADEHGLWAEVVWNGVVVRQDASEPDFEPFQPLRSVLLFLATFEFLGSSDDIDAALDLLDGRNSPGENFSPGWPGARRRPPRRLRRVLKVIRNLKAAAW